MGFQSVVAQPASFRSVWPICRGQNDPLTFLEQLAATDFDVVPFRLGRRQAYLLNHPARIEDVLVRRAHAFVKGRGFDRAKQLLGTGLLTATDTLQRERRLVAQGAFHRRQLTGHASLIVGHAAHRRDAWRAKPSIDIATEMRELTLNIAGEAFFGADLGGWSNRISQAVSLATSPMDGLLAIVAPPGQTRRARRELDTVLDAVIAARRRGVERPDDLLSMLLDAQPDSSEASERQLRDDALTFMLAGHDTISHALTWAWLLLAAHRDVDERLAAEIAAVLGERLPEATDVPSLVYTRAVVAEALRLFPPAWVIVRRAAEAHRLGDVDLAMGAIVVASPFITHRDRRFFANPLQFAPERWVTSEVAGVTPRPKLAYFPFGAGRRACIGEGFAWLEATLVLATLAQHWRLSLSSGPLIETSARVTLRPKNAPPMIPVRRLPTQR